MSGAWDLAIIGSGFGGSLLAMVARRLGLSVLLLERGRHPRFAVGESTSPLTNLLLEQLARRYDLPRLLPFVEYGSWQRSYPEIGCGLKRGFSFYAHAAGQPFVSRADRQNELLVAASPCNAVADTHWLRADFDHFLVSEAQALGVEYQDRVSLDGVGWGPGSEAELHGEQEGRAFAARVRYLVDASGPRGFLARALGLVEAPFTTMPSTQSLFTHFAGVRRWAALYPPDGVPPYPPDAAAVHHVFAGGWIWVLRFENGVTSAGVAATDALAAELRLADGAPAWERLLARFPSIREQFDGAAPVRPFLYSPRLSYRSATWSGPGWALLPSAAAFVDPLFSTGIPLTLLGIERLGRAFESAWGRGGPELDRRVAQGAALSAREVDAAARLVGASYAGFRDFPLFAAFSMFYFVAASHSEMARRVQAVGCAAHGVRPSDPSDQAERTERDRTEHRTPNTEHRTSECPPLFLRVDHPSFGPAFEQLAERLTGMPAPVPQEFAAAVRDAIAPLNVAGLGDAGKRNWYPVELRDVVENAGKLGMSRRAMERWAEVERLKCPPSGS